MWYKGVKRSEQLRSCGGVRLVRDPAESRPGVSRMQLSQREGAPGVRKGSGGQQAQRALFICGDFSSQKGRDWPKGREDSARDVNGVPGRRQEGGCLPPNKCPHLGAGFL